MSFARKISLDDYLSPYKTYFQSNSSIETAFCFIYLKNTVQFPYEFGYISSNIIIYLTFEEDSLMSVSSLKQLFLVAFLGLTLVGCSSTPTSEEGDSATTTGAETTNESSKDASNADASSTGAETSSAGSGTEVAVPTNAAGQTAEDLLALLQGKVVNFDFDRSEVKSEFYDVIKMNADYMSLDTSAALTVKGFCDERGTREYNLALGERRANAVKNALVAQGVSPSRINLISYGEENPVDYGHTEAAWAKNRRAEFSY